MHRLVLVRHAKSSYPDGVVDHDRPLAARGSREARLAGRWLRDHVHRVDQVIVSSAVRTQRTLELVAAEFGPVARVETDARVYDADLATLVAVVHDVPAVMATTMIVGHALGLPMLAYYFAQPDEAGLRDSLIQKFPTSAIAVIEAPMPWQNWTQGCGRLTAFHVPREEP
jgi:phosphohistidine phosphatase